MCVQWGPKISQSSVLHFSKHFFLNFSMCSFSVKLNRKIDMKVNVSLGLCQREHLTVCTKRSEFNATIVFTDQRPTSSIFSRITPGFKFKFVNIKYTHTQG